MANLCLAIIACCHLLKLFIQMQNNFIQFLKNPFLLGCHKKFQMVTTLPKFLSVLINFGDLLFYSLISRNQKNFAVLVIFASNLNE